MSGRVAALVVALAGLVAVIVMAGYLAPRSGKTGPGASDPTNGLNMPGIAGGVPSYPDIPVPASSGPAGAGGCAAYQLQLSVLQTTDAVDDRHGAILIFTNLGGPCTITGYPILVALRGQDIAAQAADTPAGPLGGPDREPGPVHLTTGESASAVFEAVTGPDSCASYDQTTIAPPGDNHWSPPVNVIRYACSLEVHPLVAGTTGAALNPPAPVCSFPGLTADLGPPCSSVPPLTAVPSGPVCASSQLKMTLGPGPPSSNNAVRSGELTFTNTGKTCRLSGYPAVLAVDDHNQPLARAQPSIGGMGGLTNTPIPTVSLGHGRSAHAIFVGLAYSPRTNQACPNYPALLVSIPADDHATRVPSATAVCGMAIGPIQPTRR